MSSTRKKQRLSKNVRPSVTVSSESGFSFMSLPRDLRNLLARFMPLNIFYPGSQVSREFYKILHGPDFWGKIIRAHFPYDNLEPYYVLPNCDWSTVYRMLEYKYEQYNPLHNSLLRAVKSNEITLTQARRLDASQVHDMDGQDMLLPEWAALNSNQSLLNAFYKTIIVSPRNNPVAAAESIIATHQPLRKIGVMLKLAEQCGLIMTGADGHHLLALASKFDDIPCMQMLINHGASIDWTSEICLSMLNGAANHGKLASLQFLLAANPPVNVHDSDGGTPLMNAAKSGQLAAMKLLIAYKVNVNDSDKDHTTALHYAAKGGHTNCAALLLEHGASVNVTSKPHPKKQTTPLHYAARAGSAE